LAGSRVNKKAAPWKGEWPRKKTKNQEELDFKGRKKLVLVTFFQKKAR